MTRQRLAEIREAVGERLVLDGVPQPSFVHELLEAYEALLDELREEANRDL